MERGWPQLWALALALGLAFFAAGPALATGDPPAPIVLSQQMAPLALGPQLQMLRDDERTLGFEDVRSAAIAARFTPSGTAIINHGFTSSAYWYRFALRAHPTSSDASPDYVLELKYPMLDYVDVYIARGSGAEVILIGDQRPAASLQLPHRTFAVPIKLQPGEAVLVYLRVQTSGSHDLTSALWSSAAFRAHCEAENLLYGLFYGVMLVMTLYNLIVYLWIRDRAYLYYVVYTAAMAATILAFSGHARQFGNGLWTGAPVFINASVPLLIVVTTLFGTLFGREFMHTRQNVPRLHQFTTVLVVLAIAIALVSPLLPISVRLRLGAAAGAASLVVLLAASAYLAVKGMRAAQFYLLAWGVFIVAFAFGVVTSFGLLPGGFQAREIALVGVCIDVTLLSLALADRINAERRERFVAQSEALAAREQALNDSHRVERLKNFLPGRVAEMIVEGDSALLAPKRREVTVCVMDLRDFTPFAETTPPEDVMGVLRDFYETIGAIVEKHGGTVEHFAGDSMLVFFNAPLEVPEPEANAVRAALDMREAFDGLRGAWTKLGHELGLGIGIADGFATIGAIGFSGRSQYAAIGAVTNLASRLCSAARHGEILTTSRVLAKVEEVVEVELVGEQTIRGFHRPVNVVRVVGLRAS